MIIRSAAFVLAIAVALPAGPSHAQPAPNYQGKCSDAGCHDQYGKRTVVHDPAGDDSCDACHEPSDDGEHKFTFVEQGAALCFECHDEFEGKVMHSPAEEGECTTCHDPHASQTAALLQAETVGEMCAECHEEITEDLAFLHGPVAAGACTGCHNPHASEHATLLLAEGADLCLKCHQDIRTRMADKQYKHSPVEEGCTECHNPHGAANNMMLNAAPPDLCIECHDTIEEIMEDATVQHDALTTGKSCTGCHQPHASDVQHILIDQPMDLCLSCHNKELDSGDGKILNIAKVLKENPNHHGPIADKNCTACHKPHGGETFRMLIEAYPQEFYASFAEERYALCFECHESDLVLDERTEEATNFRNGDRNLHFLHVNRQGKGRTCRACHNVHASKQPSLITETVPFGEWHLPVNYQKTPSGGSCSPGCHRTYRYDREQPVANIPNP